MVQTIEKCPVCKEDCGPFLSNGISIEVPNMQKGKITDRDYYHAHCIIKLQKGNGELKEIMIWLLGYNDFPAKGASDGNYYWRSHLRKKLKHIGVKINPPGADNRK